jgi:hypothetical protein
MHAELRCVICGKSRAAGTALACNDCQAGFDLVDQQLPDLHVDPRAQPALGDRVQIGPTDV